MSPPPRKPTTPRRGADARFASALGLALAALASFAVGLAIARRIEGSTPPVEPALAVQPVIVTPEPAKVDASPADSQKRIDAVFTFGAQQAGQQRDAALYAALLQLSAADFLAAAADFPALLARMKKNGQGTGRNLEIFIEAWMDRWLTVDAPGALHFLGGAPLLGQLPAKGNNWDQWRSAQGAAIRILARREPRWTHEFVAALPPAQRYSAAFALLDEVARHDPAQARRFLASFADGVNRLAAVEGFVTGLATADARAGFDAAMAEKAGPFRDKLLDAALREAGKRGLAGVSEMLNQIDDPGTRLGHAHTALASAHRHSSADPLPWIAEQTQRAGKLGELGGWAEQWRASVADAVQGPHTAAAAEWAATLGNDPKRDMLKTIATAWAGKEPEALRTWLAGAASPLDAAAVAALGPTLAQMAKADRAAVQTWADALPAGRLREQAHFEVALRSSDPAHVAAVYESVAARDASGALARQVAGVLAAQDGPLAAQWAMQRAEGPARRAAIENVADRWGARDPRATAEWLGQMPPGPDRDAALRVYSEKVAYADPVAAAEWAEQVIDPKLRETAATRVFSTWNDENPAAARAWVRGLTGVSDKFREDRLPEFQ